MTTRVLLFGMNGQLGTRLTQTLSAAGYEITGIDQDRCDFSTATAKEIATIIRAVEPAIIINAAAYTAVDQAESEPEIAHRINATLPEWMAAAAEEQSIPFMHFSTDYVFDGLRGAPYREDAKPHPISVYGKTKHDGEQAALRHGAHLFRLQWVFDARGKNFFLTMKKLLAEREEIRVVADQIGAPSNALHVALALTQAVPDIVSGVLPSGSYHLTAQGHTSWHGFTCAIAEATHSTARVTPIVTAEYPVPAARPKDGRLNTDKLAAHGISMPHWREGLAQAMKDSM